MRIAPTRRKPDPTITLINVVFLMLIFFLVAGTVAPRAPAGLTLVRLADADPLVPPEVLAITVDGRALWKGAEADPLVYLAALPPAADGVARLLPDHDARALRVVEVARMLRAGGAREVRILAERGTP